MANLFGKNRLREEAEDLNSVDLTDKIEIVRRWHEDLKHGTLLKDNETAREQQFNQDFFVEILGFRQKPASPFTLEPKSSTATGQIPDARLGIFDDALGRSDTSAVVELKSASINLDRPQKGEGNFSPVQQGFKYRPQYRGCAFVIVSNFQEIRLYNDTILDYEEWTLDSLVSEEHDYLNFKTFYVLLRAENLLRHDGSSRTEAMLSDIRTKQQEIGRKFYADYRDVRISLLDTILRTSSRAKDDPDFGIEKTQKIIDRVVFCCFAEDRGLLPDDTLERVVKTAEPLPFSLWTSLKGFFSAINSGDTRLGIPVGYNGGLFARDTDLDDLTIPDDIVRRLLMLGAKYNFVEDLSVNILGHIFEQSITDLEEIRALAADSSGAILGAKVNGRRKSDGIYYTPEYVVRHMIDRTVGAYLRAEEQRLITKHKLKGDILDKNYAKREQRAYLAYREVLTNIRILDAACGSGAYLTAAYDYLLAEHKRVAQVLGDIFGYEALTSMILRQNLYGVDLNEESVEITKLSLWLKSAMKGNKLEGLDKNVRAGNSIKCTGAGAFDWNAEFPEAMEAGGFHAVAMNPPYVKEYTNRAAFDAIRDRPIYQGKMDLWYAFGDLALDLVVPEIGRIAFIAQSNWTTSAGASKFRDRVIRDGRILELNDFGDLMVFRDAGIQTMIYVMTRSTSNDDYTFPFSRLLDTKASTEDAARFLSGAIDVAFERFPTRILKREMEGKTISFNNSSVDEVLDLVKAGGTTYLESSEIAQGIVAPQDYLNQAGADRVGLPKGTGVFNLSRTEYDALELNSVERSIVKPFYTSAELSRYVGDAVNRAWVIYTDSSFRDPNTMSGYPHLRRHLDRFQTIITSHNAPYGLHRARDSRFFTGVKIMSIRKAAGRPTFTYTEFDCYVSQAFNSIKTNRLNMHALAAILNSRLIAFWLRNKGKMQGAVFQVDKAPLLGIPIAHDRMQTKLATLASANIASRRELVSLERVFQASIETEAPGWTAENRSWWELSTEIAIARLGAEASIARRAELAVAFDNQRVKARAIAAKINELEEQTDACIYEIYGLSEDQILIVESNIPPARI